MKKLIMLSLITFSSSMFTLNAQNSLLFGMTAYGGTNNKGVIFSYDPVTGKDSVHYNFDGLHGAIPYGNLIEATNGVLYGMTNIGGVNDSGVLFSFNRFTGNVVVLVNFSKSVGYYPHGSLLEASDGLLYGLTGAGGTKNDGVLFSFNTTNGKDSILYNFDGIKGQGPGGNVIQASNGMLYGMTGAGGKYNYGVIFSYNIALNNYDTLFSFNYNTTGGEPAGSLIQDTNGLLYGFTEGGGKYLNLGVFFSYNILLNVYDTIFNFNDTNNSGSPDGSLIQAYNGKLYGLGDEGISNDIGSIFSYNIITGKDTNEFHFTLPVGRNPLGSLIQSPIDSLLYGMTELGGTSDKGTIFSFNTNTNVLSNLLSFTGLNGEEPSGDLLVVNDTSLGISTLLSQRENVIIFPNPFHISTNIIFKSNNKHIVKLRDVLDRKIMQFQCTGYSIALSRGDLASGIYILTIEDENGRLQNISKLLIQ